MVGCLQLEASRSPAAPQQLFGWPTIGSVHWDLLWYWQLLPYKHTPHIDGLDAFETQLTL